MEQRGNGSHMVVDPISNLLGSWFKPTDPVDLSRICAALFFSTSDAQFFLVVDYTTPSCKKARSPRAL